MRYELLFVVVIVTALVFDFTNRFHDAANAMATSIATHAPATNGNEAALRGSVQRCWSPAGAPSASPRS
ncbi:MAG: hypothetical protein WBP81_25430 [Solirubrobacteraceae bacterium]